MGSLIGGLAAVAAFLLVLVLAIDSAGWVIGLVFAWILGLAAGAVAFWIGRYLWPIVLLALICFF